MHWIRSSVNVAKGVLRITGVDLKINCQKAKMPLLGDRTMQYHQVQHRTLIKERISPFYASTSYFSELWRCNCDILIVSSHFLSILRGTRAYEPYYFTLSFLRCMRVWQPYYFTLGPHKQGLSYIFLSIKCCFTSPAS